MFVPHPKPHCLHSPPSSIRGVAPPGPPKWLPPPPPLTVSQTVSFGTPREARRTGPPSVSNVNPETKVGSFSPPESRVSRPPGSWQPGAHSPSALRAVGPRSGSKPARGESGNTGNGFPQAVLVFLLFLGGVRRPDAGVAGAAPARSHPIRRSHDLRGRPHFRRHRAARGDPLPLTHPEPPHAALRRGCPHTAGRRLYFRLRAPRQRTPALAQLALHDSRHHRWRGLRRRFPEGSHRPILRSLAHARGLDQALLLLSPRCANSPSWNRS